MKKIICCEIILFLLFVGCKYKNAQTKIVEFNENDYSIFQEFTETALGKIDKIFRIPLFLKNVTEDMNKYDLESGILRGGVATIHYQTDWGRPDKKYLNVFGETSEFSPLFYKFEFSNDGLDVRILSRDFLTVNEETAEVEMETNSVYRVYHGFIPRAVFLDSLKYFLIGDLMKIGRKANIYVMEIVSESKKPPYGTLIGNGIHVYYDYNQISKGAYKVENGDRVEILFRSKEKWFNENDELEYWYLIKMETGQEGWIYAPYLKPEIEWINK